MLPPSSLVHLHRREVDALNFFSLNFPMRKPLGLLSLLFPLLFGCHAKFVYQGPAQRLNPAGPTVAIMPVSDQRVSRDVDMALEKNYMTNVQRAIASEFASLNAFSAVKTPTSDVADASAIKVVPVVRELDWQLPEHSEMTGEAFLIGLCTGMLGGSIYLWGTDVNVWGHSIVELQVQNPSGSNGATNSYAATVLQKKMTASSDTPKTRAAMMAAALAATMEKFKADFATNSTLRTAAGQR
jgi:hypothetical protein